MLAECVATRNFLRRQLAIQARGIRCALRSPLCGKEGIGRESVVRRLASPVQFEG
jgi:hypothetical protein